MHDGDKNMSTCPAAVTAGLRNVLKAAFLICLQDGKNTYKNLIY